MAGMAGGPAETIRALREMDEEMVRAVAARNADRLVDAYYAEDARMLPENHAMVVGRTAIREFWEALFGAGLAGIALDTNHVEISGNLAYSLGTYATVLETRGGSSTRMTGKYMVVYRRLDSTRWRVVADMFSSDDS